MKKNNKGFTLVELIVVLVILAILAAILTPALIGYIDRARAEKDYSTAQTIRVAAQAAIDQAYGRGTTCGGTTGINSIAAMDQTDWGGNVNDTNEYVKLVFKLATVEKATSETGKGVWSFKFTYEDGLITKGEVVINGSTYVLSGGAWSVSEN